MASHARIKVQTTINDNRRIDIRFDLGSNVEDGRFSNLKVASFDMVARNEVKKDIAHLEIKTFMTMLDDNFNHLFIVHK